jgi:hypothetical protein
MIVGVIVLVGLKERMRENFKQNSSTDSGLLSGLMEAEPVKRGAPGRRTGYDGLVG